MFTINNTTKTLAERIGLKDLSDCLKFPKFFEIETVNACNARCVMCTIKEWEGNDSAVMKDELFQKFVDEVSQFNDWIEIICLNRDGEPTLDKKLPLKIKQLKDVGIKKVRIVTNAQRLTNKFAQQILEAGIDEVMFSIDSIEKETYEKIRIGLDFDTVFNNILDYIQLRNDININSKITIRMVEMPQTMPGKEKWLSFWKSKVSDKDSVYTMPMHNWGNQLEEEVEKKVNFYSTKACISPFSSVAIHSDGKIGICAADYNTKHHMGDFSKESIQNIWQGENFNDVRIAHLNKNRNKYSICRGCDIWDRSYTY